MIWLIKLESTCLWRTNSSNFSVFFFSFSRCTQQLGLHFPVRNNLRKALSWLSLGYPHWKKRLRVISPTIESKNISNSAFLKIYHALFRVWIAIQTSRNLQPCQAILLASPAWGEWRWFLKTLQSKLRFHLRGHWSLFNFHWTVELRCLVSSL